MKKSLLFLWRLIGRPLRKARIVRCRNRNCRCIKRSGLFDSKWYLDHYHDVAEAKIDPVLHYVVFGAGEGRDPGPNFDSDWYLQKYQDIALSGINPLVHYIEFGMQEGRNPTASYNPTAIACSQRGFLARHPAIRRLVVPVLRGMWCKVTLRPAARVFAIPEPANEPVPHPTVPNVNPTSQAAHTAAPPKLWFFLGDTIDWLLAHRQVTGVGRVTAELFFASLSDTTDSRMLPCALAQNGTGLGSISLRDSVAYLASRVGTHTEYELLDAMDLATTPPATAIYPAPGDHVLFTGLVWTPSFRALFQTLSERGIQFSVLVYDIIPIEKPEYVTEPHQRMFTEWLETTVELASAVFVSSRGIKDQILRWATLSAIPVAATIIPIEFGSTQHRRSLSAEQLGTNRATSRVRLDSFVLSVGTIDCRKNQALLCRLWQRLAADLGRSKLPQLVLVGRDDMQLASLSEDVASLLQSSDIVVLEGVGDAELAGLYRNCLLTAFPSLSEGYGLPVAESLGFGKLSLSSDLPPVREHACDLPWYFPPGDEEAAYALLRRAIADPAARTAAEARIARQYRPKSWEATYRFMARSAAQLMEQPRRNRLQRQSRPFIPGVSAVPVPAALTAAQKWCSGLDPEVSILIINWNASELTCECVRQIWTNTTGVRYEVIIADNGSDPKELSALQLLGSGVRLLALGTNRYFGEANNIAAEHAKGRYICMLNNDAFVQAGWLRHLVDTLLQDPEAGAAGPLFLFPDGTIQEAGGSIDAGGYPIRFGRGRSLAEAEESLSSKLVDYISAAALLMQRDLFMDAGGFDLAYEPAYYEDVDLCFKIRALGRKVRFCPDARVIHLEGSSANDNQIAEAHRKELGDFNRSKFTSRWGSYLQSRSDTELQVIAGQNFMRTACEAHNETRATQKTAALFTPYALTPGGGERFLLTTASVLAQDHSVTFVTPHPYSQLRLLNLGREFGIDLSGCRLMTTSEFLDAPIPDMMIVMGNHILPPIPARTKNSIFICQFPFPLPADTVRSAQESIGRYRVVITYSEYSRAHVLAGFSAYHMPVWPVEVVYPPVPQIAGAADRKKNMILSVGRFFAGGHSKRHDLMISAFRTLLERFDGELELHLVGSSMPGPEHMDHLYGLKQMASGVPIVFHVNVSSETLSGLYRDAAVYWHATGLDADLARNPGLAEHFGISIVEAMSADCIPMAFNAGGPREIIAHGVDGFLYSSLEELVDTTDKVLHADFAASREKIGRAARRRAAAFSPQAFTGKMRAIVES